MIFKHITLANIRLKQFTTKILLLVLICCICSLDTLKMTEVNNSEIKQLVEKALINENIKNISLEIEGTSEKGDGFSGDIIFLTATGTDSVTNQEKLFPLVLKCSKKSEVFRNTLPIQDAYLREIIFYEKILPAFQQFQKSKSIKNVFESVPKFYASVTTSTSEVLVLENLKKNGYELWGTKEALTLKHILMVVEKYGQFHAISVALQDQKPEYFQKLTVNSEDMFQKFGKLFNFTTVVAKTIDYTVNLLKDCCDDKILQKLQQSKEQLEYIFGEMRNKGDLKIICHGDCWTNNFMFKHNNENRKQPENVAIIDWQLSSLVSPILDLAYFTFACISVKDLNNFELILDTYYNTFSQSLKELGSNPEKLYPKEVFLSDWKKFARFGFMICLMGIKMAFTKKEDLPDLAEDSEKGMDLSNSFMLNMSDPEGYKLRIQPMVEYAVQNNLIH